jgi:drug/metabolite transporter (DMT)-like permease
MSARSTALLVALAALWGGSFAFMRVAVPAMGPLQLAFARVTLAALALVAFAAMRGRVPDLKPRWREFVVVGLVNSALPFALFSFAEQYVTASTAAILNATSPFFGAMCAAIWLGEPLTPRKTAGMALGLSGVALLVGWQPEPITLPIALALAACLIAALCYGLAGVYAKRTLRGVPSLAIALGSQASAALLLAPTFPASTIPGPVTALVIANVAGLALASTALAYLIYFRLIADVGPSRALTVTFLIPLFGVLWGSLFLGERLTPSMLGGGALIVAGTAMSLRGGVRKDAPAP